MQFEQTLKSYSGLIGRIVRSYEADPAHQADMMQDIAFALWKALPSLKEKQAERAFVARVAQNRCVSHVARQVREPGKAELDPRMAFDGISPEEGTDLARQRDKLQASIRRLPLSLRQVVTLALEGFSYREIAETLDISENNAAVRFNRAKTELCQQLKAGENHE